MLYQYEQHIDVGYGSMLYQYEQHIDVFNVYWGFLLGFFVCFVLFLFSVLFVVDWLFLFWNVLSLCVVLLI